MSVLPHDCTISNELLAYSRMHTVAPCCELVPAGHGSHVSALGLAWNVPLGQGSQ